MPDREAFSFGPFNVKHFIDRGYGFATVYYGDIEPDFSHDGRHGVRSLFGGGKAERKPNEWGSIGGWSWGLSRVMDYLQTDPAVDSEESRLGRSLAARKNRTLGGRAGRTICDGDPAAFRRRRRRHQPPQFWRNRRRPDQS